MGSIHPRKAATVLFTLTVLGALVFFTSCGRKPDPGADEKVTTLGTVEVTARLAEIPGTIRDDPLYNYAHVMKYEVLTVHRGDVSAKEMYVGHYNPAKPRADAADDIVDVGGNLKKFEVGDVHRMALEVPIDSYFMGGIINKYFGQTDAPIYWAVWTNRVVR